MHNKTKIIVLHMKEIIYTLIFVFFLLALIILLSIMFGNSNTKEISRSENYRYSPGIYTSSVKMNQTDLEVEVTVDENQIKCIRYSNLDESIETMYPLLQSSLETISDQIIQNQSIENISFPANAEYTSALIYSAISEALKKATVD